MTNTVRLACMQMNSSASIDQNLEFIDKQLEVAAKAQVELVLLPENFAQISERSRDQYTENIGGGRVQDFLAAQAQQHEIYIIAGSIPIQLAEHSKPLSRSLVFDRSGSQIASYDKIHLYDVDLVDGTNYQESAFYTAGTTAKNTKGEYINFSVVETSFAKIGLSICYDLRFPEFYRYLSTLGAEILLVPAAFTYQTGQAHWQTLLQARAIENQSFVLAAAQVGMHANARKTWGHSMIVDPWGKILCQMPLATGLLIGEIDLTKMQQLRASFPVLQHRRL